MIKRSLMVLAVCGLCGGALVVRAQEAIKVDPKLPGYQKVAGVSGVLSSKGSDTMVNLMEFWRKAFVGQYPSVNMAIEGPGSGAAPTALTEGTVQLGPMSRPMTSEEAENFEKKHGYKPTEIAVALDALSVYVHKDNPIQGLTLEQLDGIFSKSAARNITTWGQLGLTGPWANRPISLYGRNSASGTNKFFKEHALAKHDYKDTVKEQPGSAAVIQGVTADAAGIGYSGIGYLTSGVKIVPLAKAGGAPARPTYENVLKNKYPLSRALYIYVAKAPGKPLDPAVREFIKFVLSKEGQELVIREQYLPLPAALAEKQLKKLE